jgi:hypothetical protein
MQEITKTIATELARERVTQLADAVGDHFELLLSETKDVGRGWVFFFNTAAFVQSRNPADALAGNGPLLVLRDGQIHELSSAVSWKEALRQI